MKIIRNALISLLSIGLSSLMYGEESIADLVKIDSEPLDRSLNGGVVSYSESLAATRPAVVNIASTMKVKSRGVPSDDPFWRFFGEGQQPREREVQGQGSGVIISANGYILTNNHVVEDATEVTVSLQDGRTLDAVVVGTDPQTDVAVLKIESEESFPFARLADSEQIEVGDVVFAIGNPLGVGQTVTMGIVSAKGRDDLNMIQGGFENFIQTDASINQGNSGGALVDATGRLIGINTMILTDGRSSGNIGIGFAIPTSLAHSVMVDLVEKGSVARGFLGVGIQNLDSELAELMGFGDVRGVIITSVSPESPADEAGLKLDDVVIKVGEREVDSTNGLKLLVAAEDPGTTVELTVYRDDRYFKTDVILAERPSNRELFLGQTNDANLLEGVEAESLNDDLRKKYRLGDEVESGLVITSVSPDSPYAGQFVEGLVIETIKGEAVYTVKDAKKLLESGTKVALFVYVQGFYRYMALEVE
jgi:Do/DeqQ family serine protease